MVPGVLFEPVGRSIDRQAGDGRRPICWMPRSNEHGRAEIASSHSSDFRTRFPHVLAAPLTAAFDGVADECLHVRVGVFKKPMADIEGCRARPLHR
jgi:hypothetical protein